jgi:HK97 family phage portal protein
MGFLSILFEKRSLTDASIVRLLTTGSGSVTVGNAIGLAAQFTCTRILSEAIMMLPLKVRQSLPGGGSRLATELSVYWLLDDLANPEMTAAEARQTGMGHLVQWGNAYFQKVFDGAGRVVELWPLRPDRMEVSRGPNGDKVYEYTNGWGEKIPFRSWEIMHIKGLSPDGLIGYSPIGAARRTFEIKAHMDQFQESFYANGARPGMVLKHPGTLSDEAYKHLIDSWEDRHLGAVNANKTALLEEGMSIEDVGIPQSDAEFLASQKYTDRQIYALNRIPSGMANDTEAAAFASREQQSLDFVIYSLGQWMVLWEKAIGRDLLSPIERRTYYAKHTLQALLRGDNASRSQFYSTGLQNGWLSINEVRELEDMNPVLNGDKLFVPLNMVTLDQAVAGTPVNVASVRSLADGMHPDGCTCGAHTRQLTHNGYESRAEDDEENLRQSRVEMARAMQPMLEDIATRTVRREVRDLRKLVDKHLRKRSASDFRDAVQTFYSDFNTVIEDAYRAALMTYARQAMMAAGAELGEKSKGLTDALRAFVNDYLVAFGNGWAGSARTQLEIVLDEALANDVDPVDLIDQRLTRWEETKPVKTSERLTFEALNAFVLTSYAAYSITRYKWIASGESCPFCRQLSGKTAGLEEYILTDGNELDGGDAAPMRISRNVRHGPLHGGCDCVVRAVR